MRMQKIACGVIAPKFVLLLVLGSSVAAGAQSDEAMSSSTVQSIDNRAAEVADWYRASALANSDDPIRNIASRFEISAGSGENAVTLVTALHAGHKVEIFDTSGIDMNMDDTFEVITINKTATAYSLDNVFHILSLAEARLQNMQEINLADFGIAITEVLTLRESGLGWIEISQALGADNIVYLRSTQKQKTGAGANPSNTLPAETLSNSDI